jgi:serine/threonine-protein kinase
LDALVMSCLAKSPADRPESAAALQEAFAKCEGVGEWTQREARAWWEQFRGVARPAHAPAGAETIALNVDLTGRAP